jgi:hypothetical protein
MRTNVGAVSGLLVLVLSAPRGATTQRARCDSVYTTVRSVLRPTAGEGVQISEDVLPDTMPGTTFVRSRRIPAEAFNEDARPPFATIIRRDSSSAIVSSLADLNRAWPAVVGASLSTDQMRDSGVLLRILGAVGLLQKGDIVRSSLAARRALGRVHPGDGAALDSVKPPQETSRAGNYELRFFTAQGGVVYRYVLRVSHDGLLEASRTVAARMSPSM